MHFKSFVFLSYLLSGDFILLKALMDSIEEQLLIAPLELDKLKLLFSLFKSLLHSFLPFNFLLISLWLSLLRIVFELLLT